MNRRLRDLALYAEVIGGIAVLVTLIILVFEIRQSTRATRAQTAQEVMSQLIQFQDYVVGDQERQETFRTLTPEFEDINRSGNTAIQMVRRLMYVYDNAYYQYQQATLDEDVFSRYRFAIDSWISRTWFPGYWEADRMAFSNSFREYIDSLLN